MHHCTIFIHCRCFVIVYRRVYTLSRKATGVLFWFGKKVIITCLNSTSTHRAKGHLITIIILCFFLFSTSYFHIQNLNYSNLSNAQRTTLNILYIHNTNILWHTRANYGYTQPPGGIREGETMTIQTQPKIQESSTLFRIPIGSWKDGLCDFCKYGPCHPSFLISCLFPFISLGQIYTRLELTWYGSPLPLSATYDDGTNNATNPNKFKTQAFKNMVWLTFLFMLLKQLIVSYQANGYQYLYIINILFAMTLAILAGRTRRYIRERYDIPGTFTQILQRYTWIGSLLGLDITSLNDRDYGSDGEDVLPMCCGEVEDYCLGGCCYPCVLSQMSRHTAMYDTYEGSFFNSSGLPEHAPLMIWERKKKRRVIIGMRRVVGVVPVLIGVGFCFAFDFGEFSWWCLVWSIRLVEFIFYKCLRERVIMIMRSDKWWR